MLALLLDHSVDAGVIFAVVVINALIGFVQEGKAEQAIAAIMGMIDSTASVLRDGARRTIPAREVVPGDIVMIEAGDRVPADIRLIRARNLRIDEAILTGESVPVEKGLAAVEPGAPLGDRTSMAYSGSFVVAGKGAGVTVETGARTEIGRIGTLLKSVETLKTPLIRKMDRFAQQLTVAILAVGSLAFASAYVFRGYSLADAFMAVVGLVVAAIPEGLPAVMTIVLAIGVQSMARRNAIIRRLPAVETLGSVSIICSDKTGTLTRNEMTARSIVTAEGLWTATGVGYGPDGSIDPAEAAPAATDSRAFGDLVLAGLLCNDSAIEHRAPDWSVNGDPMEGALLSLARKAGRDPDMLQRNLPRRDEIPFDSRHRFMATLHHAHDDGDFIVIKGAPERLLEMCSLERRTEGDAPLDADAWRARADDLAANGQRVLAFARKPASDRQTGLSMGDVGTGAVLLGFVGFIDPPRVEARAAVKECRDAGIRVAMITGDHAATAKAIARQLKLADDPKVLTGAELDALGPEDLARAAAQTTVFARTSPENKLQLVEALQAQGHVVAMTGDGVNDSAALKRADVGVSMGRKGTEAAKEASEMVLADDNFASIVAAVREGRTVYDNLMKVIRWTLPTNGGEAMTILAALAFGLALPITPVQILWINMVTAVTLGLTLAFEPTEPGTMRRPPRPAHVPVLDGLLLWRIFFVSALFVTGAFGMFFWAEARGLPVEAARTLVVNTIVVMEIFYLFSVRYVHGGSITWQGVMGTPAVLTGVGVVVVAQMAFTYLPLLQRVFDTRAVSPQDGLAVIGIGVALLLIVEVEKWAGRRLQRAGGNRAANAA